jgi:hypothetical protein
MLNFAGKSFLILHLKLSKFCCFLWGILALYQCAFLIVLARLQGDMSGAESS